MKMNEVIQFIYSELVAAAHICYGGLASHYKTAYPYLYQ